MKEMQSSSEVEQTTHIRQVEGSTPSSATTENKMIEVGNIVWYKLDMFSDWKVGKVISVDGDYFDVQRVRISKDRSELSDTVVKVYKKFVEQFSEKIF